MKPAPRQTVDRVRHPQRGEGIAVHDNGPSFFQPDGGEPMPMRVGFGGASSVPRRSWLVLHDPEHGRVEADILSRGESHQRYWSPLLGLGWLVWPTDVFQAPWRWEGDDGRSAPLDVTSMSVGTQAYQKILSGPKKKYREPTEEESQWRTYVTRGSGTLELRKGGPPPDAAPPPDTRTLPLPGVPL